MSFRGEVNLGAFERRAHEPTGNTTVPRACKMQPGYRKFLEAASPHPRCLECFSWKRLVRSGLDDEAKRLGVTGCRPIRPCLSRPISRKDKQYSNFGIVSTKIPVPQAGRPIHIRPVVPSPPIAEYVGFSHCFDAGRLLFFCQQLGWMSRSPEHCYTVCSL